MIKSWDISRLNIDHLMRGSLEEQKAQKQDRFLRGPIDQEE